MVMCIVSSPGLKEKQKIQFILSPLGTWELLKIMPSEKYHPGIHGVNTHYNTHFGMILASVNGIQDRTAIRSSSFRMNLQTLNE